MCFSLSPSFALTIYLSQGSASRLWGGPCFPTPQSHKPGGTQAPGRCSHALGCGSSPNPIPPALSSQATLLAQAGFMTDDAQVLTTGYRPARALVGLLLSVMPLGNSVDFLPPGCLGFSSPGVSSPPPGMGCSSWRGGWVSRVLPGPFWIRVSGIKPPTTGPEYSFQNNVLLSGSSLCQGIRCVPS